MNRKTTDKAKAQARRLIEEIETMERCAGWFRVVDGVRTSKPHPDDNFNGGEYAASVKRASMDMTRTLADLRR